MKPAEYEQLISSISHYLTNDSELIFTGRKRSGKENRWKGASGFPHQIDASIQNDSDALLLECKCWNKKIKANEFLAFFGRLVDIRENPDNQNLKVRGALATTKGWQRGVEKLVRHYSKICSIFVVEENKQIKEMIHTHFIRGAGAIASGEAFGHPTIKQS